MRRADIAIADIADMQGEPEMQRVLFGGAPLVVHGVHRRERQPRCAQRRLAARPRIARRGRKYRQHAVADEFEDLAALAFDGAHHRLEPLVQYRNQFVARYRVRQPSEAAQVAIPDRGMHRLAVAPAVLTRENVLARAAPAIGVEWVDRAAPPRAHAEMR